MISALRTIGVRTHLPRSAVFGANEANAAPNSPRMPCDGFAE